MNQPVHRKKEDRRQTEAGAWMLGGALPEDRRKGADRRRRRDRATTARKRANGR